MDVSVLDRLPAPVRAELDRRRAPLPAMAALVEADDDEPVLLAGSYATGEWNPTSDLDLLVLTKRNRPRRAPGTTNHPSILGDSFDGQAGDLPVNVEYVSAERLHDLARVLESADGDGGAVDLPNLQGLEIRLVQRVHKGIPLSGAGELERLRAGLDLDAARSAATALAFVGTLSLLEDTTVLTSPTRELMCRGAAESLLMSAVNGFGPLTHDGKHLLTRAARIAELPQAPRLFGRIETLLFADRLPHEEALGLVLDLAEDLYRSFTDPRCPSRVLPMLDPFVPTWAWTGRAWTAPGHGRAETGRPGPGQGA
ncbi:nucleotidyltransferase domain-containing protein [Kitasatospora sp. NPDC093550]|uniref:nucleotidyltransferase domain-containing protein n=1 Tax=Kitasatospora sp. NPDC093550 TaxID=3364089 RepID=UPI0037FE4D7B